MENPEPIRPRSRWWLILGSVIVLLVLALVIFNWACDTIDLL